MLRLFANRTAATLAAIATILLGLIIVFWFVTDGQYRNTSNINSQHTAVALAKWNSLQVSDLGLSLAVPNLHIIDASFERRKRKS